MEEIKIYDGERLDDLHRSGYMLIQNPKRFCFGMDAVLLSSFAQCEKEDKVLDLGTGTGVIPILMCAKTKAKHFTGLEIQEESADMAKRSVLYNKLSERVEIVEGDIKALSTLFKAGSFDVITVNPPYMNMGGGMKNNFSPKAIARHEVLCTLSDVIKEASRALRFKGRFYMVHRPHRLGDIMYYLRIHKLEAKTLQFVQPYKDKEPNMVLIEALRGGNPMVTVKPPLIIYNADGSYTEELMGIYYGYSDRTLK